PSSPSVSVSRGVGAMRTVSVGAVLVGLLSGMGVAQAAPVRTGEKKAEAGANTCTYQCRYMKALEAERILKDALGDPLARPEGTTAELPRYCVTHDERLNTVVITGPADTIAKAKDILQRIDKGW